MAKEIEINSRVVKRGFNDVGLVIRMNGDWCRMEWDQGFKAKERPKICHKKELMLKES